MKRPFHRQGEFVDDPSNDSGFTLIELLITMLVTALVLPIAFGLITQLITESQSQIRTTAAMDQEENAGQWLLQYLHGAVRVLPGSNATTLNAEIENGTVATGANAGSTEYGTLTAKLVPGPGAIGNFDITLTPQSGSVVTSDSSYAENVSSVFTYYYSATSSGSLSQTHAPTSGQLDEIVAIGVTVPFSDAVGGGPTTTPTDVQTLQTTIYLQNSATAPGTTVSLAFSPSTLTHGSTITATATVTAAQSTASLSDGDVTYSVSLITVVSGQTTYTPISTSCADQQVSSGVGTGTATCAFQVAAAGNYSISATFDGSAAAAASATDTYQPLVVN